jgi:23S rRNA (guanine745-N1)-methyltransferase
VLNVFAPRNGAEIGRILAPHGALIVLTPTPSHLRELIDDLGLLDVEADKPARLRAKLSPHLEAVDSRPLEFDMTLDRAEMHALIEMGPSARHLDAGELRERLARLPESRRLTASLLIETFRRGPRSPASG